MTREEAIEILQGAIKKPNTKDGYLGQAIDMAIQALSQEPTEKPMTVDEMEREYEKSKALFHKIVECDDAVSRDAVLDTIGNVPDYDDGMVWEALSHAQRDVALLPSVKPQEPCSNCCNGNQIEKAKLCQKSYLAGMEHTQEPCADAVSREDAYGCLTFNGHYDTLNEVYERLKQLPSVTPTQKNTLENTLENTLGDAISRQAVLDAIEDDKRNGNYSCFASNNDAQCFKDVIRSLPSVTEKSNKYRKEAKRWKNKWLKSQKSGKWIPVSERLPTGQIEVIASIHDDSGDNPFDYTASGWITDDGEYWIVDGEINYYVIAWMPLPKPFEPQESEGKE